MTQGWEPQAGEFPRAPENVFVINPYMPGVYDIHWDNPALSPYNSRWTVLGVNIYRSDISDRGPYYRLNQYPLTSGVYRDQHGIIKIENEPITDWVTQGDAPGNRMYIFRTGCPIIKKDKDPYQTNLSANFADSPSDVVIRIDGVVVPVESVFGYGHEVKLVDTRIMDWSTEQVIKPVLPTPTSVVTATYYSSRNFIRSGLDTKVYYRLSTVVSDTSNLSNLLETPLDYCEPRPSFEVERLDWIWREAIRRNNWILEIGGERVKFLIRKQGGLVCSCTQDPRDARFQKSPSNRCLICYGVGFVGGYEGPFPGIVAPDDGERKITQLTQGRRLEHTYEVFTGPSPILTHRDFLVKQTNERFSIGGIRKPSNRGNILQQHFQIGYFDEQDIRYQVPLMDPNTLAFPQTRLGNHPYALAYPLRQNHPAYPAYKDADAQNPPPYSLDKDTQYPLITEQKNEQKARGRTPVYENHT